MFLACTTKWLIPQLPIMVKGVGHKRLLFYFSWQRKIIFVSKVPYLALAQTIPTPLLPEGLLGCNLYSFCIAHRLKTIICALHQTLHYFMLLLASLLPTAGFTLSFPPGQLQLSPFVGCRRGKHPALWHFPWWRGFRALFTYACKRLGSSVPAGDHKLLGVLCAGKAALTQQLQY